MRLRAPEGEGGNVFLAFYAISNISRKKHLGKKKILRKTIIFHLMFSLCFFMLDLFPTFLEFLWKYLKVPLHLLVKWERFLQIVDIGNFNMKLNGMCFPQIVDRDSRNLYPIYNIYLYKKLWC